MADSAQTGGSAAPDKLVLDQLVCASGAIGICSAGTRLTLRGTGMAAVDRVDFLGRSGAQDNRVARPVERSDGEVVVVVPRGAHSGPVLPRSVVAGKSAVTRRLRIAAASTSGAAELQVPTGAWTFPVQGKHDLGQTKTNSFGGGRGHQGQDMFASCGTPLVAVADARVQSAGTQSRAGNYIVFELPDGRSIVYMHMRSKALVATDDVVSAGQSVGFVGDSGRASGCHLHLELWTAPGRFKGGRAINPMPQLKTSEAAHSLRG